jgi:cyclic beta-1,2-glucan synthetase
VRAYPNKTLRKLRRGLRGDGLQFAFTIDGECLAAVETAAKQGKRSKDASWLAAELRARVLAIRAMVESCAPWLLPQFESLRRDPALGIGGIEQMPILEDLPDFVDRLDARLRMGLFRSANSEMPAGYQELLALLAPARTNLVRLIADLRSIADRAGTLAEEMDFAFLLDQRRKLLSVGYDAGAQKLHSACYDLLASESRIATFVGIVKEDISQESWFRLGRAHTVQDGRPVLISWTGTMFEYLMPAIWMRSYPNTLLERSRSAAVRAQQAFATRKGVPWGISESAYYDMDEAGNYQYHAFGLSGLALHKDEMRKLVISPYSTVLALGTVGPEAVKNLRRMHREGWCGPYGFYEAADFTPSVRRSRWNRYELVRCWMAHHQGMSLLSLTNFLHGGIVQCWFHADPRVQASELLLHEKPFAHVRTMRKALGISA